MKYVKSREIFENMDKSKSIINNYMKDYEKLKKLLKNNLGYIGKFTEFLFKGVSYDELINLYNDLIFLKKKNSHINIDEYKSYEDILDIIQTKKDNIEIKSILKEFPTEQKKYILEYRDDYGTKNMLLKLSKKENKNVFLSKISRYHNKNDLLKALKIFLKDSKNDIDFVKKEINNSESTIVYDNNNLLILLIPSLSEINKFGADTSWCLINSPSMWKKYTNNGTNGQFILYNYNLPEFDPNFKIGFTIESINNTIYAAHNILDYNYKSELSDLLKNFNISISDLMRKINDLNSEKLKKIKLGSNTSVKNWKILIPNMDKDQALFWLKKYLSYSKTENNKYEVIPYFIQNIFENDKYILSGKLDKIDIDLKKYTRYMKNYVDQNSWQNSMTNIQMVKDLFLKNVWRENALKEIPISFIDYFYSKKGKNVITNTDFIEKTFNIFDDIYKKDENSNNMNPYYGKSYPLLMVLLSKLINMNLFSSKISKKFKDNYSKIIEDYKSIFIRYNDIMELKIDLDIYDYILIEPNQIENIIKKDYTLRLKIPNYSNFNIFYKLVEHLKNNKLIFEVSSFYIKNSKRNSLYERFPENLKQLVSELKEKRSKRKIKYGDILTNGNLSVKYIK